MLKFATAFYGQENYPGNFSPTIVVSGSFIYTAEKYLLCIIIYLNYKFVQSFFF